MRAIVLSSTVVELAARSYGCEVATCASVGTCGWRTGIVLRHVWVGAWCWTAGCSGGILLVLALLEEEENDCAGEEAERGKATYNTTDNGADWSAGLVIVIVVWVGYRSCGERRLRRDGECLYTRSPGARSRRLDARRSIKQAIEIRASQREPGRTIRLARERRLKLLERRRSH